MFVFCNPNPSNNLVGDCVVRAISIALNKDWETSYMEVVMQGLKMHDMPSANSVWGSYLKENGFRSHIIPDTCPDCYTVKNFCEEHNRGTYILATGTHVIAVLDGDYLDTWDSGDELPVYFWQKED